jgi:hypothetical protein
VLRRVESPFSFVEPKTKSVIHQTMSLVSYRPRITSRVAPNRTVERRDGTRLKIVQEKAKTGSQVDRRRVGARHGSEMNKKAPTPLEHVEWTGGRCQDVFSRKDDALSSELAVDRELNLGTSATGGNKRRVEGSQQRGDRGSLDHCSALFHSNSPISVDLAGIDCRRP